MADASWWRFELGDGTLGYRWRVPALGFAAPLVAGLDLWTLATAARVALGDEPAVRLALFAPFAIGATYWFAASWFNHTEVRVTRAEVVVRHGPLPGWGERRFARPLGRVRLEVRRAKTASEHEVCAEAPDGTAVTVVGGLNPVERAQFVAEWLTEQLRLTEPGRPPAEGSGR